MNHSPLTLPILVAGVACCTLASFPASAQDQDRLALRPWARNEYKITAESPQDWMLEVRGGPYRPEIDDEFSNGARPYQQVFGDTPRVFLGVQLDYQALKIKHFGYLGPGLGIAWTQMSANAKITGTDKDSEEETSLWILPAHVYGVVRIDVLARDLGIPLVPYAKGGLGYALWRVSDALGRADYQDENGNSFAAKGHSYGWMFAPGLMLELDGIDPHAASQLDDSAGVNHSYLFIEWMHAKFDGLGQPNHLKVGTSTWATGFAFNF